METPLLVLIVDDNPVNIQVLKYILSAENVEIQEALNGETALKIMTAQKPDIVLLDVMLPGMNGYEVCKWIKTNPIFKDVMTVIMSNIKIESENISEGLEIGADAYISRPISNREFSARLKSFFKLIRTEKALIERENQLRRVLDASPFGLHSYRINDQDELIFIGYNPAADHILGIDHAVLIGKPIKEAFPQLMGTGIPEAYYKVAVDGSEWENELVNYEDSLISGAFDVHAFQSHPGHVDVFFEDITERKKSDQALSDSELHLRTLINAMQDIVCFKDGEGRWLTANDFDLKLFQLEGIDYKGKKDSELAEYSSFYREAFLTCEASDEIAWNKGTASRADEVIPLPDGTVKIFDIVKIPTYTESGERKGLIVVGRDITERKKAGNQLRQKIEELELFNNLTIDRELKMIELKQEINTLLKLSGKPAKYTIS